MNRKLLSLLCLYALTPNTYASTAYGSLSNFDAVNDTGVEAHGFEIEIDDVHSTAIQYTFDWNHYGTPTITEDNSDPAHPKTFVRYESKKDAQGNYLSYTAVPVGAFPPTQGHQCTNPAVNQGCEHFGVSYSAPSAVKYHWLIDNPAASGNLIRGAEVLMSAPSWTYQPPVAAKPAQVVAVIPAPPAPRVKEFGVPSWVKVIKTKLHNNKKIPLDDLSSADKNADGKADWTNGEVAEVESEWYLLQTQNKAGAAGAKQKLAGKAEALNNGNEQITRRYEFYKYVGGERSLDGETGEAMCDKVAKDAIHGAGKVDVTDANGDSYLFNCATEVVVGDYTGAQMVGFDAAAPLGLIEHIENGEINKAYTNRTVVVGGNSPYVTTITGALPQGLNIDSATGVLSGTPTQAGAFDFSVHTSDANNVIATKTYHITITDPLAALPVITSDVLTDATELAPYNFQLTATGGTAPYNWSVNALPAGLQLSASGLLSGTPTQGSAGVNAASYSVTDQTGQSDTKVLTLKVNPAAVQACSQTDAAITSVGRNFLVVNGGLNASDHVWYTPTPAGTTFTGGTTTFLTGELITYTGTLDAIGSCHATTMTVKPKPAYTVVDNGQGRISAVGNNFVVVNGKKISWNAKTMLTLKVITAINVGNKAVWKGKLDVNSNTVLATKLTVSK